jgi:hypothetical protein
MRCLCNHMSRYLGVCLLEGVQKISHVAAGIHWPWYTHAWFLVLLHILTFDYSLPVFGKLYVFLSELKKSDTLVSKSHTSWPDDFPIYLVWSVSLINTDLEGKINMKVYVRKRQAFLLNWWSRHGYMPETCLESKKKIRVFWGTALCVGMERAYCCNYACGCEDIASCSRWFDEGGA